MSESDRSSDPLSDEEERALAELESLILDGLSPDAEQFLASRPHVAERIRERVMELLSAQAAVEERLGRTSDAASRRSGGPGASDTIDAGTRLGDYRIVGRIGHGGMGVVYLAEQISLRRPVALKVLPAHVTLHAEAIERFRREASMAARLHHPGIVEIHAIGEQDGAHFFAMEFIAGSSLDKVVERMRGEPLEKLDGAMVGAAVSATAHRTTRESPVAGAEAPHKASPSSAWNKTYIETACRVVAQVADALEYAHRAGIVHRDVKPSNILVREDGSPVLTDFGLAREDGPPSLTITGGFAGTPHYSSPEQVAGRRESLGPRTDVYSLGVTLYELLALRKPFEGRDARDVLARIATAEPPNPRRWNPMLPRDLVTIVLKSLEKDPERRYASAADFAADLRAFLAYKPIAARPASTTTRVRKFVRRHRGWSASAAALVSSLALAGVWWWQQPGYLTVTSPTQGATVFIDGIDAGRTPLEEHALSPGLHRVRLVMDSEDLAMPDEEEVLVRRGRVKSYDRTIPSREGVVRFESDPPGAHVTLHLADGSTEDVPQRTPVLFRARPGAYRATFELDGFDTHERDLTVGAGGAETRCTETWETGELDFGESTAGAQVEIFKHDRLGVGPPLKQVTLPLEGPLKLPARDYALRARLRDHDRLDLAGERAIRVERGPPTKAEFWLTPIQRKLERKLGESIVALVPVDLDLDGLNEIVIGTPLNHILALRGDGSVCFDQQLRNQLSFLAAVDLDGDERLELVGGFTGGLGSLTLFARKSDGSMFLDLHTPAIAAVVSILPADLTGDAGPELVVLESFPSEKLYVLGADGRQLWNSQPKGIQAVLAVDLEGDARVEIVGCTASGTMVAYRADGTILWPTPAAGDGTVVRPTPAADHAPPILAADLNRDGRPELVTASKHGGLLALNADGSPRSDWLTGKPGFDPAPGSTLLLADVDADGQPEIVGSTASGRIVVLEADGTVRYEYEAPGTVLALAAVDLDGSGFPTVAAGTDEGQLLVLDADGALRFDTQLSGAVNKLAVVDFDGDGRQELVAGTSKGTVVALASPAACPRWEAVAAASVDITLASDLDADGHEEILAATAEGEIVGLDRSGARVFEASVHGPLQALLSSDLDGSGVPEVVAATRTGRVVAFSANGSQLWEVDAGSGVTTLAAADLEGDGRRAILVAGSTRRILGLDSGGSVVLDIPFEPPIAALLAIDLDGDGHQEIVAGENIPVSQPAWKGLVHAFDRTGARRWTADVEGAAHALVAADLDGDGRAEIVGANSMGKYRVFALDGMGNPLFVHGALGPFCALAAGDLDGDGRAEVVAGTGNGCLYATDSNGLPRFEARLRGAVRGLAIADLDGNGRPEVLAASEDGQCTVFDGRGSCFTRLQARSAIYHLVIANGSLDTRPEILLGGGRFLSAFPAAEPDPRYHLRQVFLEALQAAERGDEVEALRGFDSARLGWLLFDDSGLGGIRGRLTTCSNSRAAGHMAEELEHVRPALWRDWLDATVDLVRCGRSEQARVVVERHLSTLPVNHDQAQAIDDVTVIMAEAANLVPYSPDVVLDLCQAAVAASERMNPAILNSLAWALHKHGRSAEAVEVVKEALAKFAEGDPEREGYAADLEQFEAAVRSEAPPAPATTSSDGR